MSRPRGADERLSAPYAQSRMEPKRHSAPASQIMSCHDPGRISKSSAWTHPTAIQEPGTGSGHSIWADSGQNRQAAHWQLVYTEPPHASLAGWGSQSQRARSSRRAHNPQISSSNLLPAIKPNTARRNFGPDAAPRDEPANLGDGQICPSPRIRANSFNLSRAKPPQ